VSITPYIMHPNGYFMRPLKGQYSHGRQLVDLYLDQKLPATYVNKNNESYQPDKYIHASDGGSIPVGVQFIPSLRSWAFPYAYYSHDSMYRFHVTYMYSPEWGEFLPIEITEDFADKMLLELLKLEGCSTFWRYAIYYAVKRFGKKVWEESFDNKIIKQIEEI